MFTESRLHGKGSEIQEINFYCRTACPVRLCRILCGKAVPFRSALMIVSEAMPPFLAAAPHSVREPLPFLTLQPLTPDF